MQVQPPKAEELTALIGPDLYSVWNTICSSIDEAYDMDHRWNTGGKAWTYEYKFRHSGKTLCALYAKEQRIGFMVILGKRERAVFEANRGRFSKAVQNTYDESPTYHDGKWLMFEPTDTTLLSDFNQLLRIKRKPSRK